MDNLCPTRRTFAQLIAEDGFNARSPVIRIPYIGAFYDTRLRRLGFQTVGDLVLFLSAQSAEEIDAYLSKLFQNRRKNMCTETHYHVPDINHCAYNSVRAMLAAFHARRNAWRQLRFRRKPTFPDLPPPLIRGTASSKTCSCLDQYLCDMDRSCRYHIHDEVCVPRFAPGFQGVGDFPGQRSHDGNVAGLRYTRGWRDPGPIPTRALPRNRTQPIPQQQQPPIASRTRRGQQQEQPIASRTRRGRQQEEPIASRTRRGGARTTQRRARRGSRGPNRRRFMRD